MDGASALLHEEGLVLHTQQGNTHATVSSMPQQVACTYVTCCACEVTSTTVSACSAPAMHIKPQACAVAPTNANAPATALVGELPKASDASTAN
jgi:hypothetical protein